jgi:outer membrane receptor protein involved in Fe transport
MGRISMLTAVIVVSLIAGTTVVRAEDQAETKRKSGRTLEKIQVTATRRAETTLEVPTGTTVVDRDDIRQAAAQTVMDALHGETGTFVQQTTPGQGVVIVRGLKGSEVLHLVDGFRLNNAIFRNAPNQYIALVDGQMLDRIEVVRGPMSTLYGGDAMGGVVQMLSHEPRFDGADTQYRVGVRTIYGSADRSWLSRAEGEFGNERWALSAGATYQDVDTLRVGGGARIPFTDFTARGADLKLRGELAPGHEMVLTAQTLKQPRTPRVDELVPGFGQTNPTSSTFFFEPQERDFYQLRYRFNGTAALFDTLDVQIGRQAIVDGERNRDVTDGLSLSATRAVGDAHLLTYGAEYYRDEVESSRLRRNINTGALSARPSRFPNGSTMRQMGLFVADDWRASERWDINGGLRYSSVEVGLPPVINNIGVKVDEDDLSGNLGAAFRINDGVRWVANVGRGFRAPNVFDLGTFGDRPGNRFNMPNPNLKPETVVTFDTGFKFVGARAQGELIAFRSKYRDKITAVLTGEVTESGRLVVQSQNATELDLWGVEAGAQYALTENIDLRGTLTYTRGEEEFDGDQYPADRIPPLFGKAGLRWRPRERLDVEGYVLYAGEQDRLSPRDVIDPRINPNGTGGWVTWNGRVGWRANDNLDLALRVENLGDKRYREHGTGLDEPGRSFIVTVDWRW